MKFQADFGVELERLIARPEISSTLPWSNAASESIPAKYSLALLAIGMT